MAKKKPIDVVPSQINSLRVDTETINKIPRIKVKVYNEEDKPVDKPIELWRKPENNKVDIILIFNVRELDTEIEDETVAWYDLVDFSSKSAYLTNKKIALINYVYDNFSPREIDIEQEDITNISGLSCKLKKNPIVDSNNIKTIRPYFKKEDGEGGDFDIKQENIRIFAYFNLPRKIENDELMTFSSPSKQEKLFWTPTKIFVAVFTAGLIVALLYFYRKKIWAWIKREDKTKKKEQVEIF